MPAILAWIAGSWLGKFVLQEIAGRLASFIKSKYQAYMKNREIKKESEASVDPLKKATTAEEIDAAADDALDRV